MSNRLEGKTSKSEFEDKAELQCRDPELNEGSVKHRGWQCRPASLFVAVNQNCTYRAIVVARTSNKLPSSKA